MFQSLIDALDHFFFTVSEFFPANTFGSFDFNIKATLAIVLLSFICGSLGSLVVGNRMAFFSDALAHIAFAGVALGLLIGLLVGAAGEEFRHWITLIMVLFGVTVGLLIAYVQETTGLPSDTVIGVFFAGALGLGAILVRTVRGREVFNLESFLFGDLIQLKTEEFFWLIVLALVTLLFLLFMYNPLVLSSFNTSLAQARHMPGRLARYLFVALLGLAVNLCQASVGVLLINGLLIVPAATAANLSGNMRQLFWRSIAICLICGLAGQWFAWEVEIPNPFDPRSRLYYGLGGIIVVLSVIFFFLSIHIGRLLNKK